jgi:tetratricopeptide (TPR) repeat protein
MGFSKKLFGKDSNKLSELERYEEALESCERAIELQPDYASAWNNKGIVLNELGRYEEALEAYDRIIELQPDFGTAWYNKGLCRIGKHNSL